MKQINKREIENFDAEVAAVIHAQSLVPLTTVVSGSPEFVWDENDELVLVEVSL